MGAQKNHLIESVLLRTHNICFGQVKRKKRKLISKYNVCNLIWRPAYPICEEKSILFQQVASCFKQTLKKDKSASAQVLGYLISPNAS